MRQSIRIRIRTEARLRLPISELPTPSQTTDAWAPDREDDRERGEYERNTQQER